VNRLQVCVCERERERVREKGDACVLCVCVCDFQITHECACKLPPDVSECMCVCL